MLFDVEHYFPKFILINKKNFSLRNETFVLSRICKIEILYFAYITNSNITIASQN